MKIKINKQIYIGLISVLLGLIAGAILMAFTGNNPFLGYSYLFRGGLMNIERMPEAKHKKSLAKLEEVLFGM